MINLIDPKDYKNSFPYIMYQNGILVYNFHRFPLKK